MATVNNKYHTESSSVCIAIDLNDKCCILVSEVVLQKMMLTKNVALFLLVVSKSIVV